MFAPNIQNVAVTTDATPDAQRQRLLAAALARRKMAEADPSGGRGGRQQQASFAPRNGGQMAAGLGMVAMGEMLNKIATDREAEKTKQGAMAQADAMVTAVQSLGGPFANINANALKGAFLTNPELASQVVKMGMENMLKPQERFETVTLPDGRQAQRSSVSGRLEVMPEGRGPTALSPGQVLLDRDNKQVAAVPERPKLLSPEEEKQKIRIAQESRPQTTINNNVGGQDKFQEQAATMQAKRFDGYIKSGQAASGNANNFSVLRELNRVAPNGPIQGRLAEMFPNFSTAGSAFTAIVNQIAPTMRVEGSGATSDMEMNLFMQGLPRLRNTPEANEGIIGIMERKSQLDMRRGALARQAFEQPERRADIERELQALDQQSIMTPDIRKLLGIPEQNSGQQQPSMAQPAAPVQGPPMPEQQGPMPQQAAPQGMPPLDLIEQEIMRRQQQQMQQQQPQMPMVP